MLRHLNHLYHAPSFLGTSDTILGYTNFCNRGIACIYLCHTEPALFHFLRVLSWSWWCWLPPRHCPYCSTECVSQWHEVTPRHSGWIDLLHRLVPSLPDWMTLCQRKFFLAVSEKPTIKPWAKFVPTHFQREKYCVEIIRISCIEKVVEDVRRAIPINIPHYFPLISLFPSCFISYFVLLVAVDTCLVISLKQILCTLQL